MTFDLIAWWCQELRLVNRRPPTPDVRYEREIVNSTQKATSLRKNLHLPRILFHSNIWELFYLKKNKNTTEMMMRFTHFLVMAEGVEARPDAVSNLAWVELTFSSWQSHSG